MTHIEQSASRSHDDEYLRVLFPRSWVTTARGRSDEESLIASAICLGLWAARENARLATAPGDLRRVSVSVDNPSVGPVLAIVCLDCPWVAWDEAVVHPGECLAGIRQEPDIRPTMGAIRVSRAAAALGGPSWGPYFDALYPKGLVRDFVSWKRSSSGASIARRLWEQRESLRAASPHGSAAMAAGAHIGVVLDAVLYIAHAACLTCTWLDTRGTPMSGDDDWRSRAAEVARVHELESGA